MPNIGFDVNFKTGTAKRFAEITPDSNSFYCIVNEDTSEISLYIGANRIGSTFLTPLWKYNETNQNYDWIGTYNPFYKTNSDHGITFWWQQSPVFNDKEAYVSFNIGDDGISGDLACLMIETDTSSDFYRFDAHEFRIQPKTARTALTVAQPFFSIESNSIYYDSYGRWSRYIPYYFGTAYMNGDSIDLSTTLHPSTFDPAVWNKYKTPNTNLSTMDQRGEFIVRYYDLFEVLHMLDYNPTYITNSTSDLSTYFSQPGADRCIVIWTGSSTQYTYSESTGISTTITLQPNTIYDITFSDTDSRHISTFIAKTTYATQTYVDTEIANAITNAIGGEY